MVSSLPVVVFRYWSHDPILILLDLPFLARSDWLFIEIREKKKQPCYGANLFKSLSPHRCRPDDPTPTPPNLDVVIFDSFLFPPLVEICGLQNLFLLSC